MLEPKNLHLEELDEDDVLLRIDSIFTDEDYFEPPEEVEKESIHPTIKESKGSTGLGQVKSSPPVLNNKSKENNVLQMTIQKMKQTPGILDQIDEERV